MRSVVVAMAFFMVSFLAAGSAVAENSLRQGNIAFSVTAVNALGGSATVGQIVDEDFVVTGRYFLENDFALLAGLGIGIKGGDADGTDVGVVMGARKYLRVADFAPFVGGRFEYYSMLDSDLKKLRLLGEAGAEYFLSRQFSVEGSIGFGYTSVEVGDFEETTVGTRRAIISFNFYL